jgi:hypothetical protein
MTPKPVFVAEDGWELVVRRTLQYRQILIVGTVDSENTRLLDYVGTAVTQDTPPRSTLFLDARSIDGSRALTDQLNRLAADSGWIEEYLRPYPGDPFAPAMQIRELRTAPKGSIVLLDHPDREQALWFFGSMRDEMFNIPITFVVTVAPSVAECLNAPPMDIFFDSAFTTDAPEQAADDQAVIPKPQNIFDYKPPLRRKNSA